MKLRNSTEDTSITAMAAEAHCALTGTPSAPLQQMYQQWSAAPKLMTKPH